MAATRRVFVVLSFMTIIDEALKRGISNSERNHITKANLHSCTACELSFVSQLLQIWRCCVTSRLMQSIQLLQNLVMICVSTDVGFGLVTGFIRYLHL